ncbi:MAG TPA: M20/M25/M40 family metallo-hydrolase [Gemmatimonadales bacterium]|nr:M20/M25/M40 family metallo-hydrolase [Gemmatimonadales bacterium]
MKWTVLQGAIAILTMLAPTLEAQAVPYDPAPGAPIDFAALREEAAQRLSEYLRINTTNLPGNELAAARWLQQTLAKEGIEGRILDTAALGPGRANFYARLPGSGKAKAIALVHHMDVVPARAAEWQVDPFGGEIRDGAVWGRGALDMKGHGIIQLMAMIALKRAGVRLDRDLVFVGNADEEIGGLGSRTFVKDHPDLVRGIEYVLTESGDTRVEQGRVRWFGIGVGEKLTWWKTITAHGTASHASVPTRDNPVSRLVRALQRIADWETPVRLTPAVERYFKSMAADETGSHRTWLADPAAALRRRDGRAWLLGDPRRNALLRNTVTPTVLTGSSKTNVIPQTASAELDIRLLPDQDTVAFRRDLERVIGDSSITLESIGDMAPPYDAPLDTELFHAIERVAGRMLPGIPVATTTSTGASDKPYWSAAGPIAYGISPWLVELEESRKQAHGVDERLSLANLEWGVRMYVGILMEMGGGRAESRRGGE